MKPNNHEQDPTAMQLFPRDDSLARGWEDLGAGVPSLIALAKQASIALTHQQIGDWRELSGEAQALLYAARDRGAYEVKAVNTAFEAHHRWLAITVEEPDDSWTTFRPAAPEGIVRFFEGFSELCRNGLVMHQIYRDFSLTSAGFAAARQVDPQPLAGLLDQTTRE